MDTSARETVSPSCFVVAVSMRILGNLGHRLISGCMQRNGVENNLALSVPV
jgi:hypothetical protein